MATADELIKKYPDLVVSKKGPSCTVGASPHRKLIEALCERGLNSAAVHRITRAEKIPVPYTAIARHRSGDCQCRR
jgi:hypothetical protein